VNLGRLAIPLGRAPPSRERTSQGVRGEGGRQERAPRPSSTAAAIAVRVKAKGTGAESMPPQLRQALELLTWASARRFQILGNVGINRGEAVVVAVSVCVCPPPGPGL
jgi:hypothetical protein